jgi:hypothetical protein
MEPCRCTHALQHCFTGGSAWYSTYLYLRVPHFEQRGPAFELLQIGEVRPLPRGLNRLGPAPSSIWSRSPNRYDIQNHDLSRSWSLRLLNSSLISSCESGIRMPHVGHSRTFLSNSNLLSHAFFAVLKVIRMTSPPNMRFNFLHAPSNIFTFVNYHPS